MFDSSAKIFSITGYEDDEFKRKIDLFELQVAPEKFDINFGKEYEAPGKNANGDKLVKVPRKGSTKMELFVYHR